MKILFLHSTIPNYLTDALFHGLKLIAGINVVDIPRIDYMYTDAAPADLEKTGSRGNTLYKLLSEELDVKGNRTFWQRDVETYDLIIFTDIFQQFDLFYTLYKTVHPHKRRSLCIVDGYDVTAKFPFFSFHHNLSVRPWSYIFQTGKVKYFKREFINIGELYGISQIKYPFLNKLINKAFPKSSHLLPISMSIPEEHIEYISLNNKKKEFVDYNIDPELDSLFPDRKLAELGKWQPAFDGQDKYYDEIKNSKFGLTARRAGWDCLRHYEYAAKGAILCFKHLDRKSPLCAPFDLDDSNCIAYSDKEDLMGKLKRKSQKELEAIQENQYKWVRNYTTKKVAMRFLDQISSSK